MKVRTVVISVVVTAALVGGGGYGAYYAIKGQKTPVEVVPVANVNSGGYWWSDSETIYGSVTSQVSQTIQLNDEYSIDEIFVEEGDKVKAGDPLFSYDMTLPELELEMEQLTLQTKELTLTKLQKDLEKYKSGNVDATLDDEDDYYTTSAEEEKVIEEQSETETEQSAASTEATQENTDAAPSGDQIQLEGVEEISDTEDGELTIRDCALSYEQLVAAIDALFISYGDRLQPDEVGSAINEAVAYYRKHLAREQKESVKQKDGTETEQMEYVLKEEVQEALGEEDTKTLEHYAGILDAYQVRYVDLLIRTLDQEKDELTQAGFQSSLKEAKEAYALLATSLQKKVTYASVLKSLEEYESDQEQTETEAVPEKLGQYVGSFQEMAKEVLSEGASSDTDYVSMFENAIAFYQTWLAVYQAPATDGVLDAGENGGMDCYVLKDSVKEYLDDSDMKTAAANGTEVADTASEIKNLYETLCKTYFRTLFDGLDLQAIQSDRLEQAIQVYQRLGSTWKQDVEDQWQAEHQDGSNTLEDLMQAYTVLEQFQEYQNLDETATEEERLMALQSIMSEFLQLTETQQAIVAADQNFVAVMQEYGLWDQPEETELPELPETEYTDSDWGDSWGDDWGDSYTASELQELIEEKEREIKNCELEIRESEITVGQKQRVVDGKIVKSTMDGTVISIGNPDGESDEEYFAKVANETGLYARGAMSELDLEQIHIGDTISGMMTDTGVSFTAVVTEISEYPASEGSYYSFSSGNTNASYYPFYALIDDTEDITEGEAEIQLSESVSNNSDSIYLEKYFVRTENDGRSYVFIEGEDGLLKKQYVTTGKVLYSWAIEIVSGLELTDNIAFPYGTDVVEGAPTKEVDMLEY